MTDVDRLLAEDGARWRAVQADPPEPDPTVFTRRRRSGWQPVVAAAAVAAIASGAVTAAALRSPDPAPVPAAPSAGPIVRDGDRVTGAVTISAVPGKPVRICAAGTNPTGGCSNGLTAVGVDLDRLDARQTINGTVVGRADLTGVYRAGTITVTEQRRPAPPPPPAKTFPAEAIPAGCPVPAGGWPSKGRLTDAQMARVAAYVDKFDHEFGGMWVGSPNAPKWEPQVMVVSTPLDVPQAAGFIRRIYSGPLCVVKVTHRREEMVSARNNLTRMVNNAAYANRYHLTGGGGAELVDPKGEPYTELGVLIWTADVEELHFFLGTGVVRILPSLRKVS